MFLLHDDDWCVKQTKDKGCGIFVKKQIQAGTIIGDYLGKVIKTAQYDLDKDTKGLYLMYLTDQASIYPNLSIPGIHLLNHSCRPNCWMYIYRGHTLFFALKDIAPGEELTVSYLLSPKDETCVSCGHVCMCGSEFCTGTIHLSKAKYKKWQTFQNAQKKKTIMAPFVYGKNLPKLSSYPNLIPGNPIYAKIYST